MSIVCVRYLPACLPACLPARSVIRRSPCLSGWLASPYTPRRSPIPVTILGPPRPSSRVRRPLDRHFLRRRRRRRPCLSVATIAARDGEIDTDGCPGAGDAVCPACPAGGGPGPDISRGNRAINAGMAAASDWKPVVICPGVALNGQEHVLFGSRWPCAVDGVEEARAACGFLDSDKTLNIRIQSIVPDIFFVLNCQKLKVRI